MDNSRASWSKDDRLFNWCLSSDESNKKHKKHSWQSQKKSNFKDWVIEHLIKQIHSWIVRWKDDSMDLMYYVIEQTTISNVYFLQFQFKNS